MGSPQGLSLAGSFFYSPYLKLFKEMDTNKIMGEKQKKRPIWITIFIFLLLYIIAKFFGGILGRQQARNEGYLTGNELRETYKKSHIDGCVQAGSTEEICSCTFEGLISRLGLEGYKDMGSTLTVENVGSSKSEEYIDIMTEELIKCRQKIEGK